jgi:glycosyltransferase involved in cell wall biosynthesis
MFLVHDLIPLSHPEYFLPGEDVRHRTRMETIARHANVVIFNSRATQAAWNDFVAANNLPRPQGSVVPLGAEEVFLGAGPALNSDVPYFVVVGTLESRKNLSFLLHVWKAWTQASPIPRARLVIIGRRGRHSENTTDLIDRSAALASSVVEIGELADAGLAVVLRGARALLAPSLIEGFGLPIAEALALGVPVIASDIPAHREVGNQCAEYLDPLDGPAWFQAIDDYAALASERRTAMRKAALGYRAVTWDEHLRAVKDILANRS